MSSPPQTIIDLPASTSTLASTPIPTPIPTPTTTGNLTTSQILSLKKRPVSPSSESSASKRAASEEPSITAQRSVSPYESGFPRRRPSRSTSSCRGPETDDEAGEAVEALHLHPTFTPAHPRTPITTSTTAFLDTSRSGYTTPTTPAIPHAEAFSTTMSTHAKDLLDTPTAVPVTAVGVKKAIEVIGPDPTLPLPSGPVQALEVQPLNAIPLAKGQYWYLISRTWYKRWLSATLTPASSSELEKGEDEGLDVDEVGPVDNKEILNEKGELKRVQVGVDVELASEAAWKLLVGWYGVFKGHELKREVIAPSGIGQESVEFFPPKFVFQLLLPPSSGVQPDVLVETAPVQHVSIGHPLSTLINHGLLSLGQMDLSPKVKVWRIPEPEKFLAQGTRGAMITAEELKQLEAELVEEPQEEEADLNTAMLTEPFIRLVLEQALTDGSFQTDASTTSNAAQPIATGGNAFGETGWLDKMEKQNEVNFLNPKYKSTTPKTNGVIVTPTDPTGVDKGKEKEKNGGLLGKIRSSARFGGGSQVVKVKGLTGLSNLGNTCFMNAAVQCMSNCPELKQYFLSGVYTSELNPTNPLGMGGKVAEAFGQLVSRLWDPNPSASTAPREFKAIIGRFNSAFLGYGQQDSQELLAFLLDALHEDLNRVKTKPFDEIPDWEGGGDEELMKLGERCWELYKRRNDSVIVDLFQGQYKSTLVCPVCGKVAIKFDEVLYLTLGLRSEKKFKGTVFFVPLDQTKPRVKITYEVPMGSSIREVKRHLGGFLDCDPDNMAVVEDWGGKPWKIWADTDTVDTIQTNDIITYYQTPEPFAVLANARTIHTGTGHLLLPMIFGYRKAANSSKTEYSFVLSLSPEELGDFDLIYEAVIRQLGRYTTIAEEMYEEEEEEAEKGEGVESMDVSRHKGDMGGEGEAGASAPEPSDIEMAPVPSSSVSSAEPSASSSTQSQQKRRRVPKDLFTIHVPDRPTGKFPTKNNMGDNTVLLSERRPPPASFSPKDPVASSSTVPLPGGFLGVYDDDDLYGDSEPKDTTEASGDASPAPTPTSPATPPVAQPLLVSGDYLEIRWNTGAYEYFFGDKLSTDAKWKDPPTVDDPAMLTRITELKNGGKKNLTLQDCLRDLRTPEELGVDDMWRCPQCKEFRQATKTMQIWKAPDILVVHFKRFKNRSAYGRMSKIEDMVDFPIEGLNLSEDVESIKVANKLRQTRREKTAESAKVEVMADGEPIELEDDADESLVYDLFAVDNHFGGLGGGHYTAYAKNEEDGKWHNYDDSHVSLVSNPESIITPAAYLLFYRRRTSKVLGAKTHGIVTSALQSRDPSAAPSEAGDPPAPNQDRGTPDADDDMFNVSDSLNQAKHSPPSGFGRFLPDRFLPEGATFPFGGHKDSFSRSTDSLIHSGPSSPSSRGAVSPASSYDGRRASPVMLNEWLQPSMDADHIPPPPYENEEDVVEMR